MPRADSPEELARRREKAWWMRQNGSTIEAIAKVTGVSRQSVMRDLKMHVRTQLEATGVERELTAAIHESIISQVSHGTPPRLAAQAVNVPPHIFDGWCKLGQRTVETMSDDNPPSADLIPYVRLYVSLVRSEAVDVNTRVERINEHGKTTYKADQFMLQTRHDDFAPPTQRTEVKTQVDINLLNGEIAAEAFAIVTAAHAAGGLPVTAGGKPIEPRQPITDAEVVSDSHSLLPAMPPIPKPAPAREPVHPINEQAAELERNTDTGRDARLEQRRIEYAERATRHYRGSDDRSGEVEDD